MARPDSPNRFYLDATLWIDATVGSGNATVVSELLALAQSGKVEIIASTILLVEVRSREQRIPEDVEDSARVHRYLQSQAITYVELDRYTAGVARTIAGEFGLTTFDAVHLASAVVGEAEVFMTDDGPVRTVGREYQGVWIDEPFVPTYLAATPGLF